MLRNNYEVACVLAEAFGDTCACNFNGIDEWLPLKCDFVADGTCPYVVGVACWEQYLKHKDLKTEMEMRSNYTMKQGERSE